MTAPPASMARRQRSTSSTWIKKPSSKPPSNWKSFVRIRKKAPEMAPTQTGPGGGGSCSSVQRPRPSARASVSVSRRAPRSSLPCRSKMRPPAMAGEGAPSSAAIIGRNAPRLMTQSGLMTRRWPVAARRAAALTPAPKPGLGSLMSRAFGVAATKASSQASAPGGFPLLVITMAVTSGSPFRA